MRHFALVRTAYTTVMQYNFAIFNSAVKTFVSFSIFEQTKSSLLNEQSPAGSLHLMIFYFVDARELKGRLNFSVCVIFASGVTLMCSQLSSDAVDHKHGASRVHDCKTLTAKKELMATEPAIDYRQGTYTTQSIQTSFQYYSPTK